MDTNSNKYTRSSHVLPRSVVTNLVANHKAGYVPNASQNSIPNPVEQKLLEQFVYFKEEFLDTALSLDIPIPLDLVENKSQLLKPFLKSNGPKYVFQIIQSNLGNIQLLRSGISLMITTLAILKRNLPKQYNPYIPESPQFSMHSSEKEHHYSPDEQKAIQAIAKICDIMTVPSIVSILLCTHNPLVQELLYSLLAGLVTVSDDAITQMLQVPNILNHQSSSSSNANNATNTAANAATSGAADSTRDRMLSMHLKKLNSRTSIMSEAGSPLATSFQNGNFMNNESRKSFMSTTGGGGGGAGGALNPLNATNNNNMTTNPNLPTANLAAEPSASLRYALRLDRGNSKGKLNDLGGEDRPEETSCCLQYLLSILLVQKNRHLLYAGYADIIIAMTKNYNTTNTIPLCEVIARSPTVELPMLDSNKTSGNQHNHLKHLYSNTQQQPEAIPINPLGHRIIDWAGIKVPLKFLQKYYKLFSAHHDLPGSRHRSRVPSSGAGTGGGGGGGGGGGLLAAQQDKIISDSTRKEYQYAHNRTLLAICSLIVGAPSIAQLIATLSGAIDLISWSSGIYEDEDAGPANTGYGGVGGGGGGGGYSYRHLENTSISSGGSGGAGSNHHLPNVIQQALQYLQIEKQILRRSKAAAAAAGAAAVSGSYGPMSTLTKGSSSNGGLGTGSNGGSVTSGNNSGSIQSFPVGNQPGTGMHNTGMNSKPNSAPGNNTNNPRRAGSSQKTQRLKPLDVTNQLKPSTSTSPTTITKKLQIEQVSLTTNFQRSFGMDYTIETEQYKLYLQNRMDTLRHEQIVTPMQLTAVDVMRSQAQGPLQRQNLTSDSLLNTSLNVIATQAARNIHSTEPQTSQSMAQAQFLSSKKRPGPPGAGAGAGSVRSSAPGGLMSGGNGGDPSIVENTSQQHLLSWSFAPTDPTLQGDPVTTATHMTDPTAGEGGGAGAAAGSTGLSSYHDFFAHLPRVPYVPQRIEAKDAIALGQDMTTIRKKFQVMAEEAASKIKYSGAVLRNGKNLVTIEERARRVYSPKKSAFGMSLYPDAVPTATDEENGGGGGLHQQASQSSSSYQENGLNIQTSSAFSQPLSLDQLTPPLLAPRPPTSSYPGTSTDPEKTPAWNALTAQDVQSQNQYYGLRLDNVEFEEENKLFTNFKPIFEYDTVIPADEIANKKGAFGSNTNSAISGDHKISKAKLTMQLDQSQDIALQ